MLFFLFRDGCFLWSRNVSYSLSATALGFFLPMLFLQCMLMMF